MAKYLRRRIDPRHRRSRQRFMLAGSAARRRLVGSLRIGLAWHIMGEARIIVWHNGKPAGSPA
jgi:hypothetical protein